jgi:uncharacterized protein (TIGR04255 family)
MARILPDFENPPAVETALGIRFAPLPGWNVFHYGLILQEFKDDYPKQELKPPILNIAVPFPPPDPINFVGMPVRCWFLNEQSTELVQVQSDFFGRNWRKLESSQEYLHYDQLRPFFERDWSRFVKFLGKHGFPSPEVWQCEVAYVNQFPRGREWKSFDELDALYPVWRGLSGGGLLARTQMVNFMTSYELPDNGGTLQFVSQPGIRQEDGAEMIQLTVTAIGKPDSPDPQGILRCLDAGRAAVVRGFTEFTSDAAHAIWRMK